MSRDASICPFNTLNLSGQPTYCHDGRPSVFWSKEGEDYCEAYKRVNTTLCRTNHCEIIVTLGIGDDGKEEKYIGKICEDGDCPYDGCRRLKTIQPLPLNAIIIQEIRETEEKEKKAEATP